MSNRGFGMVWGDAAAVRQVHGRGRRQDGRRHEGRGAGEGLTRETRRARRVRRFRLAKRDRPAKRRPEMRGVHASARSRHRVVSRRPWIARRLWRLAAAAGAGPAGRAQRVSAGDRHRACDLRADDRVRHRPHASRKKRSWSRSRPGSRRLPPRGRFYGLRALFPPLLLLFYVVAADRLGFILTAGVDRARHLDRARRAAEARRCRSRSWRRSAST